MTGSVTESATSSATGAAVAEWVSVTQAARRCRVSQRTVHRWIATGEVEACLTEAGYRRIRSASLPEPAHGSDGFSDRVADSGSAGTDGFTDSVSDTHGRFTGGDTDRVADVSESTPRNGASHKVSPDAAKGDLAALLSLVEQQRDRLEDDVTYLRSQLDRRAEEAARQAEAERELRVMLMQLERTNADLAASLCVKALPPAPEPEPPQKVRWWCRWRGRG